MIGRWLDCPKGQVKAAWMRRHYQSLLFFFPGYLSIGTVCHQVGLNANDPERRAARGATPPKSRQRVAENKTPRAPPPPFESRLAGLRISNRGLRRTYDAVPWQKQR